jgi:DNA polymerase epsilon subunit 1
MVLLTRYEANPSSANAGFDLFDDELINESRPNGNMNASDYIIDIREYDVPYHVRVAIDKGWQLTLHICQ